MSKSDDLVWAEICQVEINNRTLIDNIANRQIVFGWLHEDQGEIASATWFKKVLSEQPALAESVSWNPSPEQRKRTEARDKEVFAEVCRQHLLSGCEANFSLWRSTGSSRRIGSLPTGRSR